MNEAEIIINFMRAKEQADKLDELAERLSQAVGDQLIDVLQNLACRWKGDNAGAYIRKGTDLGNKITATADNLRDIASGIRTAAQRIYETEMEAAERARYREY